MKNKHSVNIQWSERDQVFIATVPEIEGLNAFGETPDAALKELEIAKELFIKVMEEDGEEVPEAVVYSNFSGQFRVRIPKSLHASLTHEARGEGVSLNTHINHLLSERNAYLKVTREIEKSNKIVIVSPPTTSAGTSGNPLIYAPRPDETSAPTRLISVGIGSKN
jgi:antitoxin HicB